MQLEMQVQTQVGTGASDLHKQGRGSVGCMWPSIGAAAESTLGGGQDTFAQKYMYEKLTKCPNFTRKLPEK